MITGAIKMVISGRKPQTLSNTNWIGETRTHSEREKMYKMSHPVMNQHINHINKYKCTQLINKRPL